MVKIFLWSGLEFYGPVFFLQNSNEKKKFIKIEKL